MRGIAEFFQDEREQSCILNLETVSVNTPLLRRVEMWRVSSKHGVIF